MQSYTRAMSHPHRKLRWLLASSAVVALAGLALAPRAQAQNYPVTPEQKARANEVAQKGVPLSELAANAPDQYTIKSGDTLWAISKLFLKSPWRWPELWGMNLNDIANPHRIYPGQQLFLIKSNGRATLSTRAGGGDALGEGTPDGTIKVLPRNRSESLNALALPTLAPHLIEPFLSEPSIVGEAELANAPRIVATQEGRVMLSRGDRAYVRGPAGQPLLDPGVGPQPGFRVFRNAVALKHPETGVILGYEAHYVGRVVLARSETAQADAPAEVAAAPSNDDSTWSKVKNFLGNLRPRWNTEAAQTPVAATIDVVESKEEMRVGDRLLPEPAREVREYTPKAPQTRIDGRVVSVYGGVVNAGQNQVVAISAGTADGLRSGDILAILKNGPTIVDRTNGTPEKVKLPNERNGLMMVFRPFDKMSYALILETTDAAKVGDHVVSPE